MGILESLGIFFRSTPILLIVGIIIIAGFYIGRSMKIVRLPFIVGYLITGILLGPSLLNLAYDDLQKHLEFITEITLGFVALNIGLELSFNNFRKQGKSLVLIIIAESFGAFFMVAIAVYALTNNLPLALIFGAIAPASAPAGTVAVIKECNARGSLTRSLYAVVGLDDGLAIIIFGFAANIAQSLLFAEMQITNMFSVLAIPLKEIFFSLTIGITLGIMFSFLIRKSLSQKEIIILIFSFILVANGLCKFLHLSLILTNMVIGLVVSSLQRRNVITKIENPISEMLPLLFILFFVLAGAHLDIRKVTSLSLISIIYILARSFGLIGGAWLGAFLGKSEPKIRKYLGLGILSQAGVAIGLSLIVKQEFKGLGKTVEIFNGIPITSGDKIGTMIITSVTLTSIFFEFIGPILTKVALKFAGEVKKGKISTIATPELLICNRTITQIPIKENVKSIVEETLKS